MVNNYRKGKNGLFILSKKDIENEAESLLNKYFSDCLYNAQPTPIEELIENVGLSIEYKKISANSEILGAFVFNKGYLDVYDNDCSEKYLFNEKTIIIDSMIAESEDRRLAFTYGHELGHYVTQYSLFHIDKRQMGLFDIDEDDKVAIVCNRNSISSNSKKELVTKEDWQEWQANYFSSSILIPKTSLSRVLTPYLENYDIMSHEAVLNKLETEALDDLIHKLSRTYDVSNEMMRNRLIDLGYLNLN